MAKKLAPLVIPAVIDTSGIDRGVNSIRSKLSRVRGGGNVGGGGSGFGSGINPYPGGGFGGGSAVGSAMAAAFGAAAGSRTTGLGNFAQGKKNVFEGFSRGGTEFAKSRQMTRRTAQSFFAMRIGNADFLSEYNKDNPAAWEVLDAAQQGQQRFTQTMQRQQQLRAAVRRGMFKRNVVGALTNAGTQLGAIGSIGGALAATKAAYDFMNPLSMESRFADITRFEGTKDYESIRQLKASSYKTPTQTMGQSFWIGAQRQAGTKKSMLQQMGENLSTGAQATASGLGGLLESMFTIGYNAVYAETENRLMRSVTNIGLGNELRRATN